MITYYERALFRGMSSSRYGRACSCMVLIIPLAEARLRAAGKLGPGEHLRIEQLGYHNGSVSAGTHGGGGAWDSLPLDMEGVRILRECGIAAFPRTRAQFPTTGAHDHCLVIGCPHLAPAARAQVADLKAGRNGLVGHGPDNGPKVPWITFQDALKKYWTWYLAQQEDNVDLLTFRTKKRQAAKAPGSWQYVSVNDAGDVSFATGPCKATGTAVLRFTGIPVGRSAFVRLVEVDVDGKGKATRLPAHSDEWVEFAGTSGSTTVVYPFCIPLGSAPSGKKRRLRLEWNSDAKGAAIELVKVSYEKKVTV